MTLEVFAQTPYHCQYISPIFILHIYNVVLWSNCHLLMLVIASRLTANSGFSQSGKNGSTTYWANVRPWNYITVLSKDYISWYSSLSMKAVEMLMSSFITYEHTVAYKSSSYGGGRGQWPINQIWSNIYFSAFVHNPKHVIWVRVDRVNFVSTWAALSTLSSAQGLKHPRCLSPWSARLQFLTCIAVSVGLMTIHSTHILKKA